ncbi:MAG TPA: InlB B-repeat-containing protein, partial [Chitinispirillaceae bacterium]|nr:InlB B-repeat-containing protein [Chitinispirillaceae bacterium]
PSSGTYPSGTSVVLTATPVSGYRFARWSGDLTGSTNPATIVMNSNKTIVATFELIPVNYALSVTTVGSGSVSPSSGTYPSGTSVVLTATPVSGYRFARWSGDLTGSTNPATIVMNRNMAITATFAVSTIIPNAQKLTIAAKVFDNSGNPLGTPNPVSVDATIRLYDHEISGTLTYSETFHAANNQAISVSNGNLVARLGEGTTADTLRSVLSHNQNLWAEIQIGGDTLKRAPLTAAAYSINNQ